MFPARSASVRLVEGTHELALKIAPEPNLNSFECQVLRDISRKIWIIILFFFAQRSRAKKKRLYDFVEMSISFEFCNGILKA